MTWPAGHRRLMAMGGTPSSSPAPSGDEAAAGRGSSQDAMKIMVSVLVVVIFCTLFYCIYCWRWRKRNAVRRSLLQSLRPMSSSDLPLMDLASIHAATNNFSKANKLGEGGFGPVYRGVLTGGAEIAVKRLSERSRQGAAEFRNEVELIAKLQHRNLVRLLGWCAERDEKLLVYEYLPNRSLDAFLFDASKSAQLDWKTRHSIILGVARGLLYLHEDSLLKVVHRDLKASNVLLDNKMNPKISDFGMAKIFEDECNEWVHGAGVRDGRRLLGEVGRVQLRGAPHRDPRREAERRAVPRGARPDSNPRRVEAVDGRQGAGVHGRGAGAILLQGRGVAVLPRGPPLRAGRPGPPADHVHRPAHAHQRPHEPPRARKAAALHQAQDLPALHHPLLHQDRLHLLAPVHQRRLHHRRRAAMMMSLSLVSRYLVARCFVVCTYTSFMVAAWPAVDGGFLYERTVRPYHRVQAECR